MLNIQRDKSGHIIYKQEDIDFVVDEYFNKKKSFTKIGEENGCSECTIRQLFKKSGRKARNDSEQAKKYFANSDYFKKIDSEEKAYWLGFLMADGYISNKTKYTGYKLGCSLAEVDKDHLEKLKNALSYTGNINGPYKVSNGYNQDSIYYRLLIGDNKLCEDLMEKGCSLKKTFTTNYPSEDILPKKFDRDFIRGLIDGDGSVIITNLNKDKRKEFEISFTGTKELCEALMDRLIGKKVSLHQRNPDRKNNNYSFMIGGNIQALQVCEYLYKDATIYLDRKYKKYEQMLEISRAQQ